MLEILGLALGLFIAYWIIDGRPKAQARELQQKFIKLGDLRGLPRAQIEQVVGKPSSWASIGLGKATCSWSRQRYHITLLFSEDICEGVTSEIAV